MGHIDRTTGRVTRKLDEPTDEGHSFSDAKKLKSSGNSQDRRGQVPGDTVERVSVGVILKKRVGTSGQEMPKSISQKSGGPRRGDAMLAQQARTRIEKSEWCRAALTYAEKNRIPEIFIDSRENGKLIPNIGRDVFSMLRQDRSLIESGQDPIGPTAWGHIFIFIPGANNFEILSNFADIKRHEVKLSLLNDVVEIAWTKQEEHSNLFFPYAAPARLDLLFRFGLLGCEKSQNKAQQMKSFIPEVNYSDAYSFALQNAVQYRDLSMIKYCLDHGAKPFSLDLGVNDYREYSPIELAFTEGTTEIQNLLIRQLDRSIDTNELRELFLDVNRWETPPRKIIDFLNLT